MWIISVDDFRMTVVLHSWLRIGLSCPYFSMQYNGESCATNGKHTHLRALVHPKGGTRKKINFAAQSDDFNQFLALLMDGRAGESKELRLSHERGNIHLRVMDNGEREVSYVIVPGNRSSGGEGVVAGAFAIQRTTRPVDSAPGA